MTDTRFLTESLAAHHDRSSFDSGVESLDTYLRERASQDVRRRLTAVFVVPSGPDDPRVVAYYTLSAMAVEAGALPKVLGRRTGYREVPAALLGRLAVDRGHQGRGMGGALLVDAIARCIYPSGPAVLALVVDPIDERAAVWYGRFGFTPLGAGGSRLFAPIDTLRQAL